MFSGRLRPEPGVRTTIAQDEQNPGNSLVKESTSSPASDRLNPAPSQ